MNLSYRQEKIQVKRKTTPWRDFVMEIASRMPVNFYKIGNKISRFPQTGRQGVTVDSKLYDSSDTVRFSWNNQSFLEIFQKLFISNSKMIVQQRFENENCDYAESYGGKNCYLSFGVGQQAENVLYSAMSHTHISNIIDSFVVVGNCDNIFSSRCITNSYGVFFSSNIHNSHDIRFSVNLLGCSECILCNNIENQSYCISNKPYSKKEYDIVKQQLLSDRSLYELYYSKVLSIPINNKVSENVTGYGIVKSQDIEHGYFVQGVAHGRNIFQGGGEYGGGNFYDSFDSGNQKDEHLYATNYVGENSCHIYCVVGGANCNNCYYGYHLESCSFCMGCVGLRNKSYCILNKQYTKEERYEKVDEIFGQMEKDGTLGEFFPASMNPFYFNDTAAYLIDNSFTKEEVTAKGYLWRDAPIKVDIPEGMEVVKTSELGNYEGRQDPQGHVILNSFQDLDAEINSAGHSRWINPDILKKVIQDEQGNVYKIVKIEYDFLMKYGLPLPRKHWLERMKEYFKVYDSILMK